MRFFQKPPLGYWIHKDVLLYDWAIFTYTLPSLVEAASKLLSSDSGVGTLKKKIVELNYLIFYHLIFYRIVKV